MKRGLWGLVAVLLAGVAHARPNVLIIIADDLGYSDVGAFGGEIHTPNIDALAREGVQLTSFHTATNCSPTRAMLLTGTDNHLVGLGNSAEVMQLRAPEYLIYPGHEGYLNFATSTLPELLRAAGYRTYMTGKWHLGLEAHTSPHARGFERTFALLDGAANHFNNSEVVPQMGETTYRADGALTALPDDLYSSRDYARRLAAFLREDRDSDAPFFAYLAFTAPHWPLQAPEASIAKYRGAYDAGYEVLFERRLARQKALGLTDEAVEGQPPLPGSTGWDELSDEERRYSARLMEVYAAMVDDMDRYIGEVIATLKEIGAYDDTIILFMSDNGAEGADAGRAEVFRRFVEACCDNSYANMGRASSYLFYGHHWARAGTVPSRLFKSTTAEGGIRSPAIVRHPGAAGGRRYDGFLSVLDVMPTVLELAGVAHPKSSLPLKGASFVSVLKGEDEAVHGSDYVMGWEFSGHRALRKGRWKIVYTMPPLGDRRWRLHDVLADPSEQRDLSATEPEVMKELLAEWDLYVARHGVVLEPLKP